MSQHHKLDCGRAGIPEAFTAITMDLEAQRNSLLGAIVLTCVKIRP